jgi:hypothetical protein
MGLKKLVSSAILGAGVFLAGYSLHSCTHEDQRYDVRRNEDIAYLVDKKLDRKIQIVNKEGYMGLGSTLYRLITLMNDDDLENAVNNYSKGHKYVMWTKEE